MTTTVASFHPDRVTLHDEDGDPICHLKAADALALAADIEAHRDKLQSAADRQRHADAFTALGQMLAAGLPQPSNVHASEYSDRIDVELRSYDDVVAWAVHLAKPIELEERGYGKPATRNVVTTDSGLRITDPWLVTALPDEPVGATA